MNNNPLRPILPVLLFNFICLASMMAILPVVGPIIRSLGLQEWHSGLIVGVSGLFWMLLSRYWGKRSDTHGRRKTLLVASIGYCISYIALAVFLDNAFTAAWTTTLLLIAFIILRSFVGAFYAALPTVCAARVADITSTENRSSGMALLGASSGIAMITGPFVAGLLSQYSLILPLYVASFVPIIGIAIVYFAFPKQQHTAPETLSISITDPRIRLPVIASLLSSCCIYAANVCIGFYGLDILHLTPQGAAKASGYAMAAVGISMIIAQIIMTKCKNIQPISWIIVGSIFGAMGFIMVTLLHTPVGLYASYAVAALGIGWVYPAMQTMASQAVEHNEQGVAAGSVAAAQGLSMIAAPIISTILYEAHPLLPYWGAVMLMVLLLVISIKHKHQ